MWWCFLVTSGYVGGREDIVVVLTWRNAIKPVIWPGWPSMVGALLFTCCVWLSEWCCMICVSSILSSLVSVVCEMTISTIFVSCFRGTMRCVLKHVGHIWISCWRTQCCQCYSSVTYSSMVLLPFFIWCICFHLNLVMVAVVDYFDSTFHSICLGNPFLMWEGTCPTETV